MTETFSGKSIPKGVSLPADMWAWLESRRKHIGIPVSRFIQDAVEEKITRDATPAHALVDTKEPYDVS